jgi:capsule polysaccharide modification protein KpsS
MRCLDDYFTRKRLELYTDSQIKIRYHWFKYLKVNKINFLKSFKGKAPSPRRIDAQIEFVCYGWTNRHYEDQGISDNRGK